MSVPPVKKTSISVVSVYSLSWILCFCVVFIWSAIGSHDYFTWFLEVLPAVVGLFVLGMSYRQFTFSRFTYILILIHCCILMVGGHYTYAHVPLFDTLADILNWHRNNYDKLGHFAQGFIPAAIVSEILLRRNVMKSEGWVNFFSVIFCLALSAFYELIEWWVAISSGQSAEAFLGTQGYIWDTQSDMMWAFIGALVFVVCFRKWLKKSIKNCY